MTIAKQTNFKILDKLPYTTLSYANGPSVKTNKNGEREDMTSESFGKICFPLFVFLTRFMLIPINF